MRDFSDQILAWYDVHARDMPWRVPPAARKAGVLPDPYAVWLSEVMLQQTTVAAVRDYHHRFLARWPRLCDLANADDADVMAAWAGLGYYARARNLLKCARAIMTDHAGIFPTTYDVLITLPGIGPYTAAAIAAIAFDRPEAVVDGNVERVMARLYNIHTPLPAAKPALTAKARALTPLARAGDYAQAVMDLGATICTPRSPACGICPWHASCAARQAGTAGDLPRKMPKKKTPTCFGIAYVARRADGAWLLETRPASGLLGGMLGWPGTAWSDDPAPDPPLQADWAMLAAEVRHTFTHFHLHLRVMTAKVDADVTPARGVFVSVADFSTAALPTVMRKVFDLAHVTLRDI